jgi:membrane associated rhomboid family serine protease
MKWVETDPYVPLLEATQPPDVTVVRRLLKDAEIPYRAGLLISEPPKVIFSVPQDRLEKARIAVTAYYSEDEESESVEDIDPGKQEIPEPAPAILPWGPIRDVSILLAVHLVLVVLATWPWPPGRLLYEYGGLVMAHALREPYRLLTSLFLHADPSHALLNGFSMMVFGVPLLKSLGRLRTVYIYLIAGIGGGLVGMPFAGYKTILIGSSGAVAGLFGAWTVMALHCATWADLPGRARIRVIGIALLVLPSLLTPMTADGKPISIGSHLGGLATGALVGALLESGLLARFRAE